MTWFKASCAMETCPYRDRFRAKSLNEAHDIAREAHREESFECRGQPVEEDEDQSDSPGGGLVADEDLLSEVDYLPFWQRTKGFTPETRADDLDCPDLGTRSDYDDLDGLDPDQNPDEDPSFG
mgnify:CR=1 FL=1